MEASDFFVGGYFGAGDSRFLTDNRYYDQKPVPNNNQLSVDYLFDFPKEDEVMTEAFFNSIAGNSADSSNVIAVDSCNSSVSGCEPQYSGNICCRSFADAQFSGSELCVPYDDLAELEWLSNFVEESFSNDNMQNLHYIPTATCHKSPTDTSSSEETVTNKTSPIFGSDVAVPGKARSKRSRAAPCDWSSRLLLLSSAENNTGGATPSRKKRENSAETPGRRCLHCASEKTPQWRTGPLGPKTLCNACGVRYKSGRLVAEYRPAASPTFVSARHSNSHRKVIELRRQKELRVAQQRQLVSQISVFGVSNGDDYLIHRQGGHMV